MEDCVTDLSLNVYCTEIWNAHVDTATLFEERSDSSARAFWCDKDNVNVLWWNDACVILVDDRETVREVKGLLLGEVWLHHFPLSRLGSVGKQVHDDGTLLESLFDGEEVLALNLTSLSARCRCGSAKQRTQPSSCAIFQLSPSFLTPTITFMPF